MKLIQKWIPAHIDYFLVLERRGERMEYYNGQVYASAEAAQKDADAMNARRNTAKYGEIEVGQKDRSGAFALEGTLRI